MDKHFCLGCKTELEEGRFRGAGKPVVECRDGVWGTRYQRYCEGQRGRIDPKKLLICKNCEGSDSAIAQALRSFNGMKVRHKRITKSRLPYSFFEFWEWLKKTKFESMYRKYSKCAPMNRNIIKPTIDRIDGWMGYELANLQVITHSENSSKGDRTAIGRRERTMLFFKTLRNKLNLTKYEMARHLDILPQSYYYYEEKARGCSFEILSLIRKKLEISWEEIGQLIDKDVQKGISEKRKNK